MTIKNKPSYFLNIHVLHSFPASCMNRDAANTPKSMPYGGAIRGRVSSQCIKKSIRDEFNKVFDDKAGIRTKDFSKLLCQAYADVFGEKVTEDIKRGVNNIITLAAFQDAIFPMSIKQAENLVTILHDNAEELCSENFDDVGKKYKSAVVSALSKDYSADVVLFGRMLAGTAGKDISVEACCQVAHAFSTHSVSTQDDFYVAVDDLREESGAAMMGTTQFQSYTLYKFADVNVTELFEKCPDYADDALRYFLRSFVMNVPSGKQNTFANVTTPCMLFITLDRSNLSLADAFEEPIESDSGYSRKSVQRFIDFTNFKYTLTRPIPIMSYGFDDFGLIDNDFAQITGHLDHIIDSVVNDVKELN